MKGQIQKLLIEIETWERRALGVMNAQPDWEPPSLTFIEDFNKKYPKAIHREREYYKEYKNFAYKQQVGILETQLRIAKHFAIYGSADGLINGIL
jgi:hypothetical protein